MPKDTYDQQTQARERQEEEIKSLTKQVKQKEEELDQFMVSVILVIIYLKKSTKSDRKNLYSAFMFTCCLVAIIQRDQNQIRRDHRGTR